MIPLADRNPTRHRPVVTIVLIVVNIAVFALAQQRSGFDVVTLDDGRSVEVEANTRFTFEYAAIPCELTEGRPLAVDEIAATLNGDDAACDTPDGLKLFPDKAVLLAAFTSMFLHGSWFHLGFNMLFLWIFGNNIEDHMGPLRYLTFYLAAGVAALVAHVALQLDSSIPVVGASGAIAGVMGAYLVWFPRAPIRTLFVLILIWLRDIDAIWLLGIWFVTQFFTGSDSGIAWAAHVGGFVFGAVIGAAIIGIAPVRRVALRAPWSTVRGRPWDTAGRWPVAPRRDGW